MGAVSRCSLGDCSKVEMMSEQKWNGSKRVGCEDFGPSKIGRFRRVRDDPEAFFGMMDEGDRTLGGGSNGPCFAQKVDGMVCVNATSDLKSQVKVQQSFLGYRLKARAFLGQSLSPCLIGLKSSGSAKGAIVPVDFHPQQLISRAVVADMFVG